MRYKVQVINVSTGLIYRTAPSLTATAIGVYPVGTKFIATESKIDQGGVIWFKNEENSAWSIYKDLNESYIRILVDIEEESKPSVKAVNPEVKTTVLGGFVPGSQVGVLAQSGYQPMNIPVQDVRTKAILPGKDWSGAQLEQNQNQYPPVVNSDSGKYTYDYRIDFTALDAEIKAIKRASNIPSLYNRNQLNYLMHNQFNRYRINYADYNRGPMLAFVFFTRPDLNLFNGLGKIQPEFAAVPSLQMLINSNPMTAKSLTMDFSTDHDYIPLLCNRCASLDIQDETVDVSEMGETFTGYKMQYARDNIKSMTAGQLSIKFPESYNLAITILHQIWVGYESAVYRGYIAPKEEYMTKRILDYACDIYYFLCDRDMSIRFWSKYYGCFPSVVNKSVFSFDEGTLIQFPDSTVTYNYMYKEDFSPDVIMELNANSHITGSPTYAKDFIPRLPDGTGTGLSGPTWVGAPFIEQKEWDDGQGVVTANYVLRFKPAPTYF